MQKSNLEQQYEKLIIHHISNLDVCPSHRASLFLDFFRNSKSYYDGLCDILYSISAGELIAPLWLSNSGQVYACTHPHKSYDLYLTDCRDLPCFTDDLVEQLEYVFSEIYSHSSFGHPISLCKIK